MHGWYKSEEGFRYQALPVPDIAKYRFRTLYEGVNNANINTESEKNT